MHNEKKKIYEIVSHYDFVQIMISYDVEQRIGLKEAHNFWLFNFEKNVILEPFHIRPRGYIRRRVFSLFVIWQLTIREVTSLRTSSNAEASSNTKLQCWSKHSDAMLVLVQILHSLCAEMPWTLSFCDQIGLGNLSVKPPEAMVADMSII